ncbi:hypothetical protein HHI36_011320 [Cryptolaemus montrouzieri]|uniref:Uncharacterized protein n=1 Tax=Cryptolaemus montrouzieri TaxID=559131 RepID=A0ABD2MLB9_9CUCU
MDIMMKAPCDNLATPYGDVSLDHASDWSSDYNQPLTTMWRNLRKTIVTRYEKFIKRFRAYEKNDEESPLDVLLQPLPYSLNH